MTSYLACAIAEGFCEGEGASKEEQLTAWQWLVDTGTCWKLQGWYGRTANDLVVEGELAKPIEQHRDYYGNAVQF